MSKEAFPGWAEWIDSVVNSKEISPEFLARHLPLEFIENNYEVEALKHSLQSYDTRVLLLEEEEKLLLAWKAGGSWNFFRCRSRETAGQAAVFLRYLTAVSDIVTDFETDEADPYLSLEPLVYSGDYWLNKICPEEYTRHVDLDSKFSLIVLPDTTGEAVETISSELPEYSRTGYLKSCLVTILPLTERDEGFDLRRDLNDKFNLDEVSCLELGRDFSNVRELTGRVRKLCE